MQVTPGTAERLARKHSLPYHGRQQLLQAEDNIRFGTIFLRDLMDRFDQNPVLASAAYNAGPQVVERWLREDPPPDPAVWIETLPYFETRDYIPRVMAFATLYDWRLQQPVTRVSARMPAIGGAGGAAAKTADVVCGVSG
jgi:soluble lytic murein transglycosylase